MISTQINCAVLFLYRPILPFYRTLHDLQILFDPYLIEYTTNTRYLMFKLSCFWQIFTHIEFDAGNKFQKELGRVYLPLCYITLTLSNTS